MTTNDIMVIGAVAISVVSIIVSVINMVKYSNLSRKYKILMRGIDGQRLDDVLEKKLQDIEDTVNKTKENSAEIEIIMEKMRSCVSKVGLSKYDAYNGMGGLLSFALVMLDEKDNGFSINSMHGQEGSYIYIKEIKDGKSDVPLADEEKNALQAAME